MVLAPDPPTPAHLSFVEDYRVALLYGRLAGNNTSLL